MHPLVKLYGNRSTDFIEGFIAAMEYCATMARMQLTLYGRPITREELQLEKQKILDAFTENEEKIEL